MSKKILTSLAIAYLTAYSSVGIASELGYKEDELLVRFAPKATGMRRSTKEKDDILSTLGLGTIKREYRIVPGLSLIKLTTGQTVEDALTAFKRTNGILYAEPDYKIKLLSTFPNDPNFRQLWGMHNTGQTGGTSDADIDAPEAWDIHTGSQDIIVGVLDSGVDYTHPDLSDNMWVNESELNGIAGIDDDDNGYVDDIGGWDFADGDNEPKDYYFHGTHVAGIIGAVGNNNEGVAGVCWNVKIMNLKIFPNYGDEWFISGAIAAIEYGVDNGAHVLSNSWGGGPYSQSLKDEIEAADANGVLFVAAAGNDGTDNDTRPIYPASYDCNNIIAIMSTDSNDVRSVHWGWASNYGVVSVDLGAPGTDILSTFPTYETYAMAYYGFSTDYETISGTSMATPHVAGACALIWSANPTLNHLQIKQIILDTTDKLEALDGLCVSGGRLNLYNAILEATKNEQVLHKVDNVDDGVTVDPNDTITYTIYYANPVTEPNDPNYIGTLTDAYIVDYLAEEVEPENPFAASYNPSTHTCFWDIGTLLPGESNSIELTVLVNELAEPFGKITNVCVLLANEIGPVTSVEVTDVNSWNPGIVYVNKQASDSNTGMSWNNAYRCLHKALERGQEGCGSEIWVAAGTYRPSKRTEPSNPYSATFQLVNGVAIYGGFAGNETSRQQRNWLTNQTVLSGDIDNDGTGDIQDVVTALGIGQTTIIDAFTITKGLWSGLWCDPNSSPIIANNTFKANWDGVDCNGTPNIINCIVESNACYGIFCLPNSSPTITNNIIRGNNSSGIYCQEIGEGIEINIRNNWIHNNGDGIYIYNALVEPAPAVIRNNTIVNNAGYGVNSLWAVDANISNCIIWGNNSNAQQLHTDHGPFDKLRYSCIQNGDTNNGNINTDPVFYDDPNDPNNFHLAQNSPCIDTGDPSLVPEPNETDIDGEGRVKDGDANGTEIVDMGADEYYWSPADFNGDLIVNFIDYALFADAWWSNNPDFSLDQDNDVDYDDLALFCEDWLWRAAWTHPIGFMMMGQGMGEGEAAAFAAAETSSQSVSVEKQIEKVEPFEIKQLIKWLEQLWLEEETQKLIDKDLWLKFIESLKEEL